MKLGLLTPVAVGALALAAPAHANHIFNPGPYATFSACQTENVELSNEDADMLLERFPDLFESRGDVRSFLTRAFTCERNGDQWYLVDHRAEVLDSDWYGRRH